jgi:hypothetical protein
MDYLYAFLAGVLCKLYDDLHDNNLFTSDLQKELLKGSQWILLTLMFMNNFNFALFFSIFCFCNAISNWGEWKFPYESALLILSPFFLVVSFHSRESISFYQMCAIALLMITPKTEPYFFPEESSFKKLAVRTFGIFTSGFYIVIIPYLGLPSFLINFFYNCIGYCIVSSIFQAYLLMNK